MQRLIGFILRYAYGAAACLYLFTFGFLFARHRLLLFDICSHFGYRQRSLIPQVELSSLVHGTVSLQLREPVGVEGNVSLLELLILAQLVRQRGPRTLFEIGTFDGRTTLNLAANCPPEGRVYTLDLPRAEAAATGLGLDSGDRRFIEKDVSGARYRHTDCAARITQLYGDSATFDFSPYSNGVDFVFIDGAHSHDYVRNDSRHALQLLRHGRGLILWHDYLMWEGVTSALNELYTSGGAFQNLRHIKGTSLVYLDSA
jgi:predicted O-methyltransferase YrrM